MTAAPVVVVAEDNPAVNRLITTILQRAGYAVLSSFSGIEAARLVQHVQPAILVTDVGMETPDAGLVLVRQLRANPATAQIGVILCSGNLTIAREYQRASQQPRERFISKPFEAAQLRDCVRALLTEQWAIREGC